MLKLLLTVSSVVVLTASCAKTKSKPKTPAAAPVATTTATDPAANATVPDATKAADPAATATPAPAPTTPVTTTAVAGTPATPASNPTAQTTPPSKGAPGKGDVPSQSDYPSQNGGGSQPPAAGPQITRITHVGKGCPVGTVGGNVSSDAKAFTLTFSDFDAEIGPKVAPSAASTSCLVGIEFYIPANMTFTLLNLDIRGFVDLQDKVKMSLTNRFYFAEQASKVQEMKGDLAGVLQENFNAHRVVSAAQTMWSTCGAARKQVLYIDTAVALSNAENTANSGLVTVDSIDGEFTQKLAIAYKPCGS